jgi:type I restriction enzyme S subunit
VNQDIKALIVSEEVIPLYLLYYLAAKKSRLLELVDSAGHGTGRLNTDSLKRFPISVPPLKVQSVIASILSTWEKAIKRTERLIAVKEKRLCALYQVCFQKGTPLNIAWKSTKLSEYLRSRNEKSLPSEEIPLYSLTIENGVTAKTDRYNRDFLVKDTNSKTYKVVYPGDIVFNPANLRWGAIARSEIDHKVVISPIYEVLKIRKEGVDPGLLTHALTCPRQIDVFSSKTEGTLIERMAVKLDAFLLTEIMLPRTIEEQRKIAILLDSAKKEILLLKKQANAYRQQKRGLMQKLLTGLWRVKVEGEELNNEQNTSFLNLSSQKRF